MLLIPFVKVVYHPSIPALACMCVCVCVFVLVLLTVCIVIVQWTRQCPLTSPSGLTPCCDLGCVFLPILGAIPCAPGDAWSWSNGLGTPPTRPPPPDIWGTEGLTGVWGVCSGL